MYRRLFCFALVACLLVLPCALIASAAAIDAIPDDVAIEADRVSSAIASRSGSDFCFIAVSDMHELGDSDVSDTSILERYRRANLNCGQAAYRIAQQIDPVFFVNLGDLAWGASDTSMTDLLQSIADAKSYTEDLSDVTDCLYLPGNHDVLSADGYLDPDVVAALIGSYAFVDYPDYCLRVILVDTADVSGGVETTQRVSAAQLQWLAEALDLSGKEDPAAWHIVLLSHHPLDWASFGITDCLSAYESGSSFSVTVEDVAVSYDYAGKNTAQIIANFHGHVHCFNVSTLSGTSIKRIAIPNACFARTNEYGEAGNLTFGEAVSFEKTDDATGCNTSLCAVSIDVDQELIYLECFGAGYDRIVSFGADDVSVCTVDNDLTGVSTDNGARIVAANGSYAATLSADAGYSLDTLVVTVAGEDVTDTAVTGSSVYIADVSGDVVITATAAADAPGVFDEIYELVAVCFYGSSDLTGSKEFIASSMATMAMLVVFSLPFVVVFVVLRMFCGR